VNSELEILKRIWENKKESHLKLISNQIGFGLDYTRYLCNSLFKKGQIKPVKNRRDHYKITPKGKRELKLRGLIKLKKILKRKSLVYPVGSRRLSFGVWPTLKLRAFPKKTESFSKRLKINKPGSEISRLLGKEVERFASSLEKLKFKPST